MVMSGEVYSDLWQISIDFIDTSLKIQFAE